MRQNNLLVVDWDFFFPMPPYNTLEAFELYDWGHAESMLYITMLWDSRAATFIMNGKPLPRVNDDWKTFWDRFRFAEDTKLYFHESNSAAVNPEFANDVDGEVWLYDAHHDCGYEKMRSFKAIQSGLWSCEDWMVFYGRHVGVENLHVRYPTHRRDAFEEEPTPYYEKLDRQFDDVAEETPTFSTVFVCRSGAWVPSWCDKEFEEFIALAPMDVEELGDGVVEREFSQEAVDAYVRQIETLRKAKG